MSIIRNKGKITLGLNVGAEEPIDSRLRVQYLSDLTGNTWTDEFPTYDGLQVVVINSGTTKSPEVWVLKVKEKKDEFSDEGWSRVGYLAVASKDELGGVKLGYQEYPVSANTTSFSNGTLSGNTAILNANGELSGNVIEIETRKYPLELDEENRAFVNVPWSDTKYTAGENIKISENNVISAEAKAYSAATKETLGVIKLASNTVGGEPETISSEENRTYGIQLNKNEEAVVNVPWSDKTVGDILITEGSPLASARGIWENDTIPSGTSMEQIFMKLMTKELYPASPTLPTLNITSKTSQPSGIRKINSKVNIATVSASTTNGSFNCQPNTSWNIGTPSGVTWSGFTLTPTVTGFSGLTISSGTTSINGISNVSVQLGTNKIVYSGKAYYTAPTNKPKTNLGNETEIGSWTDSASTRSLTVSVTGVYPTYSNVSGWTNYTSSTKSGQNTQAMSGGTISQTLSANTECRIINGKIIEPWFIQNNSSMHFLFEYPSGRTVTSFKVYDKNANEFTPYSSPYKKDITSPIRSGYLQLYTYGDNTIPGNGSSFQITLSKSLDTY